MLDFLHRWLRRIVSRESLLQENDWVALSRFEFTDAQLLSISQLMEKTEFCTKAMKAAKGRINVEREKHEKAKTNTTASAVMGDIFNPHVNKRRAYFHYVRTELLKHPLFRSDLMVGLDCFENSVLFTLPRKQAVDCYSRMFWSFHYWDWLAKELKNVHMDIYFEFIDDLCFVFLDELYFGPKIGYVHLSVVKPRIFQRRVYVIRIHVVLPVFGTCGARVAVNVVGFIWLKSPRSKIGRRDWARAKLFIEQQFGAEHIYKRRDHFLMCWALSRN